MKYNEYIQSSWVKRQIKRHGSDLCDGLISSLIGILCKSLVIDYEIIVAWFGLRGFKTLKTIMPYIICIEKER